MKDTKSRSGRVGRLAAATLGAAMLALVGAATAAATEFAYVSNAKSEFVTPINLTTNTAETGIKVGVPTSSIAISSENNAYAPEAEGTKLTHFSLSGIVGEPITLGKAKSLEPEAIAISGEFAYIADEEFEKGAEGAVSVVNVAKNEFVTTITKEVGLEPEGIAVSGKFVYVADKAAEKQGTVAVIEIGASPTEDKVVNVIPIGGDEGCTPETAGSCAEPVKIAISGKDAYVADAASGDVTVIEIASTPAEDKVVRTIEKVGKTETVGTGTDLDNIAVAPNGKTAYAVDGSEKEGESKVVPIEIGSTPGEDKVVPEADFIPVGKGAHGIAINSTGSLVVVTDEEESESTHHGAVSVIETATNKVVGEPIPVAGEPDGVAIH